MMTISPMWAAVIIVLLAPTLCREEEEMYSPGPHFDHDTISWEADELYDAYNEAAVTTLDVLNKIKRYDEDSNEIQTLNTHKNSDVKDEFDRILIEHNLNTIESHINVQDYTDIYDYGLNATQYSGEMRNASEKQVPRALHRWLPIEYEDEKSSVRVEYSRTKEDQDLSPRSSKEGDNEPPKGTTRNHYDRAKEVAEMRFGVTNQGPVKFSKDGVLIVEPDIPAVHWSPDDDVFSKTLKDVGSYNNDDNKTGERRKSSFSDAASNWLPINVNKWQPTAAQTSPAIAIQRKSAWDVTPKSGGFDFGNEHVTVNRVTFTREARKWFAIYGKPWRDRVTTVTTTTVKESSKRVTYSKEELLKAIQRIIPIREEDLEETTTDNENFITSRSEQAKEIQHNMGARNDEPGTNEAEFHEPSAPTRSASPPLTTTTTPTWRTIPIITTILTTTPMATTIPRIRATMPTDIITQIETIIPPDTINDTENITAAETLTPTETTALPETTTHTTTTTRTTIVDTNVTLPKMMDVNAIIAIIANLTYDYEWNLTEEFNRTLIEHGIPSCPTEAKEAGDHVEPEETESSTTITPITTITTTPITTITTPTPYDFTNSSTIGKCFVCGLKAKKIPLDAHCSDAFATDFLPLMPVDTHANTEIAKYRKYCRYLDVHNYIENPAEPRAIYGRFTGGCGVRWTDITGVYTQRTCRSRFRPLMGKHFASKRMAKLELALLAVENGCIISPMATLLPLTRGMSLYARFHACVCTGNWCNRSARAHPTIFTALLLYCCCLVTT